MASSSDVNLWFAKDINENIVVIDEVDKTKGDKYFCPICGSEVIPRQGEIQTWCFAHVDRSQCNSESMVHWWVKHKLIEKGTKFIIKADKEYEYICKDILIEKSYKTNNEDYIPDLTVICENDEVVFFEMQYSNKKKSEDYMGRWLDLNNTVVEVNTKELIRLGGTKLPIFKALFHDGNCLEIKNGNAYYSTIGIYKERMQKNELTLEQKERIKNLDYFWRDIILYKKGEKDIVDISTLINNIVEFEDCDIIVNILKKPRCGEVLVDYVEYKRNNIEQILDKYVSKFKELNQEMTYIIEIPRIIYDRIYEGYEAHIMLKSDYMGESRKFIHIDLDDCDLNMKNFYENKELEVEKFNIFKKADERFENIKIDFEKNYDFENVCENIATSNKPTIKLSQGNLTYCGDSIYIDKITKEDVLNEDSLRSFVFNLIKEEGYELPFDTNTIKKFNEVFNIIKSKFEKSNDFSKCEVSAKLNYYSFEIRYYISSNTLGKQLCSKIEYSNNCIYINDDINENKLIDELLNIIDIQFSNSEHQMVDVMSALELAKIKLSMNGDILKFNWAINRYLDTDISVKFHEDLYKFSVKQGILYKYNTKICSLSERPIEEITTILLDVINKYLYQEAVDLDKTIQIVQLLRTRYKKIEDSWDISYGIENQDIVIKLSRPCFYGTRHTIADFKINKSDERDVEPIIKDITNSFSSAVRECKHRRR